MKAQRIGRALGIGLRVAGRIAGQRIASEPQAQVPRHAGSATVSGAAEHRARGQSAGRATAQVSRGVQQGVGGFLRPFRRVGGILWLEVTGVFFLVFALVFGWYVWQSYAVTGGHAWNRSATLSSVFMLLFLYLGASSFWRASRK